MQHYNQGYDELYHYGKLGMKWGKRKNPIASAMNKISGINKVSKFNEAYTKNNQRRDRKNFGPGGVKRINKQLDKGGSVQKSS